MIVVTVFLSIMSQMEFHLVQNRKESGHHDHIPFNVKGNGNIVFSARVLWINCQPIYPSNIFYVYIYIYYNTLYIYIYYIIYIIDSPVLLNTEKSFPNINKLYCTSSACDTKLFIQINRNDQIINEAPSFTENWWYLPNRCAQTSYRSRNKDLKVDFR